jgi:hypothetical protein
MEEELVIPEDLKTRYEHLHALLKGMAFELGYIERISRAEALNRWEDLYLMKLRNAVAATDESLCSDDQLLEQPGKLKAENENLKKELNQAIELLHSSF